MSVSSVGLMQLDPAAARRITAEAKNVHQLEKWATLDVASEPSAPETDGIRSPPPSAPMALASRNLLASSTLIDAMRQDAAPVDKAAAEPGAKLSADFDPAQMIKAKLVASYGRRTEEDEPAKSTRQDVTA
jgi:hypothetical protein